MHKRIILLFAALLLICTQGHAVLKEKDLKQTLAIMRAELTKAHKEQGEKTKMWKMASERQRQRMMQIFSESSQNALMLYSQKPEYVFDLTYACHEATKQYREYKATTRPFTTFVNRINGEVERYDSIIVTLERMHPMFLDEKERIDRNVCLTLATNIRSVLVENKESLAELMQRNKMVEQRLAQLNDYATLRYHEIRENIFQNGGDTYFTTLSNISGNIISTAETVQDKYKPQKKSQWNSGYILMLFAIILVYGLIAGALNTLVIRFLMPKRLRTEEFLLKRRYIILATTSITFSLLISIISRLWEQNFLNMASDLLVEYAWLLGVILVSLLIRVSGKEMRHAFNIYSPLLFMGFVVIVFRIVLVPNDLVNLTLPFLLLLCCIWVWRAINRNNDNIPRSDVFFTYVTQGVFVVSVISAWIGYTLLSVQLLIWWIMQLTCILTLTCIRGWLKGWGYRRGYTDRNFHKAWFYNLVMYVLLPIMAVASVLISIYWAADVFNLNELTMQVFLQKFIDTEDFQVSLVAILMVSTMFFVANYLCKLFLSIVQAHYEEKDATSAASRSVMGKNVIQVLVWGTWLLGSLAVLHVSNTWLVVISGGLSTGVGFASKDILENIYYGISLMTGRINIGDWIECDDTRGKVMSISYTSTMIEAIDGSVIAFQNSQLFTKNYKNLTRNHGHALSIIPFGVAYGSDARVVTRLVEDAVKALNHSCIDAERMIRVDFVEFGDNSINFRLLCWVDVIKQALTESDIMRCIYDTLNDAGIEFPFPQRDLYIKEMPKV